MNGRKSNCQYRNKLCSNFSVVAFPFGFLPCFSLLPLLLLLLWLWLWLFSCHPSPQAEDLLLRLLFALCFLLCALCFLVVILRRRRRTCFSSSRAKIPEEGPLTQCTPLGQQAQSPDLASAKRIVCAISTGTGCPSLNPASATSPGPCPHYPSVAVDLFITSGIAAHEAAGRLNVFLSRIQTLK
jgi:hypothetical protein